MNDEVKKVAELAMKIATRPAKKKAKAKKPAPKKKAAPKSKAKKAAPAPSARLDLRVTKAQKAKLKAKAAKLRRTVTSVVLEAIEKIK